MGTFLISQKASASFQCLCCGVCEISYQDTNQDCINACQNAGGTACSQQSFDNSCPQGGDAKRGTLKKPK